MYSKTMKKIDKDEAIALSTPGRADFLRDNYEEVIFFFKTLPKSSIQFERKDQIIINAFGNNEYFTIASNSRGVFIAHSKWSTIQKEWRFERNENSKHIISTIYSYLNQI